MSEATACLKLQNIWNYRMFEIIKCLYYVYNGLNHRLSVATEYLELQNV
jgi:hypothetical protein